MSEESLENIAISDRNVAPTFVDHHSLPDMNFNGDCLIKNNTSLPKKLLNLYNFYTLGPRLTNSNTDFTLSNFLFGSVELIKIVHLDKYKINGYRIG